MVTEMFMVNCIEQHLFYDINQIRDLEDKDSVIGHQMIDSIYNISQVVGMCENVVSAYNSCRAEFLTNILGG